MRLAPTLFHSRQAPQPYLPDPRLGHRPNPAYPGHDARGWRNAVALDRADIVVFGDSQIYGVNAPVEGAWPQQVGRLLNRTVYQMAYGGYGPAYYIPLLHEAQALAPSIVLAAYYFGNDIYGGCPAEARARVRAFRFFARHSIDVIDALPPLEAIVVEGMNPYPETADGHLRQVGYDAIAGVVAARLRKLIWRCEQQTRHHQRHHLGLRAGEARTQHDSFAPRHSAVSRPYRTAS